MLFPDCSDELARLYRDDIAAILPGLEVLCGSPGEAGLAAAAQGRAGLMLLGTRVTAATLAALPELRVISFLSTGVGSWVDLDAAAARGVVVRSVRGYADRAVAEHALGLALAALRHIARGDRMLRRGSWAPSQGGELEGRRFAVIGLGGTGRALAGMGAALGCEMVGWNRSSTDAVRTLPLDECLATADIVSLHLALTEATRGLIDRRRIELLRPGAVLVNTARGALLDEAALVARLRRGDIAAGLDVFANEPLPAGHPLLELDNVTLTPHSAWNTEAAGRRLLRAGLLALREEMARLG